MTKLIRLTMCWHVCLGLAHMFIVANSGSAQELDPRLTDFNATGLIRFDSLDEAEERRQQLVEFIWPDGLPTARPAVTEGLDNCPELASVDSALVGRVDRYDVDVAGFDFHSLVYVAHPATKFQATTRLAIVHAGHMPEGPKHYLEAGLSESIEQLLRKGFIVAAMQMPLTGWNDDRDGRLPDTNTEFQFNGRRTGGHNEMFAELEQNLAGQTFRFFLEPIVQVTNELFERHPRRAGLLMIGLSGGGWTTHMSAAIDPRIDISIPVAGALPLYARPFSPGSQGDLEQFYDPMFREVDSDADGIPDRAAGVASWLEVFALGAISPHTSQPRSQVQVLNYYDSCCFSGPVYKTFESTLIDRVNRIGPGQWKLFVDRSHRDHKISEATLDKVLGPAIEELEQR